MTEKEVFLQMVKRIKKDSQYYSIFAQDTYGGSFIEIRRDYQGNRLPILNITFNAEGKAVDFYLL